MDAQDKKMISKANKFDILWITILLITLTLLFCPYFYPKNQEKLQAIFFGICQIVALTGLLVVAIITVLKNYKLAEEQAETEKIRIEKKAREAELIQLNTQATNRRVFERERNAVNDLFRLIELAKEKPGDKIEHNDINTLAEFVKHYETLNKNNQNP